MRRRLLSNPIEYPDTISLNGEVDTEEYDPDNFYHYFVLRARLPFDGVGDINSYQINYVTIYTKDSAEEGRMHADSQDYTNLLDEKLFYIDQGYVGCEINLQFSSESSLLDAKIVDIGGTCELQCGTKIYTHSILYRNMVGMSTEMVGADVYYGEIEGVGGGPIIYMQLKSRYSNSLLVDGPLTTYSINRADLPFELLLHNKSGSFDYSAGGYLIDEMNLGDAADGTEGNFTVENGYLCGNIEGFVPIGNCTYICGPDENPYELGYSAEGLIRADMEIVLKDNYDNTITGYYEF